MTGGCDDRIVLKPETGLNRYYSAPYPRDVARLRLLDRQRYLGRRLCPRRSGAGAKSAPRRTPASIGTGSRRCGRGSAPLMASARTWRSCSRPRAPTSNMSLWRWSPGARRAGPMRSCSARTRSAPAASIRAHGLYFANETALGARGAPGRAGARARRRHARPHRHPGPRPDGPGAARRPISPRGWTPRSPPPAPPAGTAWSISSTARRPG